MTFSLSFVVILSAFCGFYSCAPLKKDSNSSDLSSISLGKIDLPVAWKYGKLEFIKEQENSASVIIEFDNLNLSRPETQLTKGRYKIALAYYAERSSVSPLFQVCADKKDLVYDFQKDQETAVIDVCAADGSFVATTSRTSDVGVVPQIRNSGESFRGLGLDVKSYASDLQSLASLYNSGRDGVSGARVFASDFNGYFRVHLDRSWRQLSGEDTTAVAQSRWIFMNATVHQEASSPDLRQRYLEVAKRGGQALIQRFKDPVHGGFFHQVRPDGSVSSDEKYDFSNCQPLLALASLYKSEPDPKTLSESMQQIQVLLTKFADPRVPGGIIPGLSRDFRAWSAGRYRNTECVTHFFEGLLALYEIAPAPEKNQIGREVTQLGRFLTEHVLMPMNNAPQYRYFAFFFDENWRPSQVPLHPGNLYQGSAWVSIGHNFEMAFLLSRAVEMGFDQKWLPVAEGLLRFGMEYGMDPQKGGVEFLVDYAGRRIGGDKNPMFQRLEWWPQTEAARALLHFAIVRKDKKALSAFKQQESFMNQVFVDPEQGGWYGQVANRGDGKYPPLKTQKGDIWQDAYHQTMFYAEALRLAKIYP